MSQPLRPGAAAPEFSLPRTPDQKVSLGVNPGADGVLEALEKLGGAR